MNRSVADLETFNEKSDVLLGSSFLVRINNGECGFSLTFNNEDEAICEFSGPDGESVSAVLFTLRMFIQNNDRISINNIGKIYESEPHLSDLLPTYITIKDKLNSELDKQGDVDLFGKNYTFREALVTYLYATGHTDIQKSEELREILKAPLAAAIFKDIVNSAITLIAYSVEEIQALNNKALEVLVK